MESKNHNWLRGALNKKFSKFLYERRKQQFQSLARIAAALSISPAELQKIESKPAEVPFCDLYKVIGFYGVESMSKAETLFMEAHLLGVQYRSESGRRQMTKNPLFRLKGEFKNE